jgi:hypothetical protein
MWARVVCIGGSRERWLSRSRFVEWLYRGTSRGGQNGSLPIIDRSLVCLALPIVYCRRGRIGGSEALKGLRRRSRGVFRLIVSEKSDIAKAFVVYVIKT